MFERFTDRARRVIVLAQEEARTLQHNYIGTEHLLLGLIREGEGARIQGSDLGRHPQAGRRDDRQGKCVAERPHSLHPACQAGVGAVAT